MRHVEESFCVKSYFNEINVQTRLRECRLIPCRIAGQSMAQSCTIRECQRKILVCASRHPQRRHGARRSEAWRLRNCNI